MYLADILYGYGIWLAGSAWDFGALRKVGESCRGLADFSAPVGEGRVLQLAQAFEAAGGAGL